MEIKFEDGLLEQLETDVSCKSPWPPSVVRAYRKRINFIRQALNERDLYAWKSLQVKKLQGERRSQHVMRLNDQWRLIFQIKELTTGNQIVIISIEDYHS
jgi:proteic killer suppression protein